MGCTDATHFRFARNKQLVQLCSASRASPVAWVGVSKLLAVSANLGTGLLSLQGKAIYRMCGTPEGGVSLLSTRWSGSGAFILFDAVVRALSLCITGAPRRTSVLQPRISLPHSKLDCAKFFSTSNLDDSCSNSIIALQDPGAELPVKGCTI